MKLRIVTIGSPQLSFAKDGFAEYIKRLGRFHALDVVHVKEDRKAHEKMLEHCDGYVIALDENGTQFTSRELAELLDKKASHGVGEITFVIGPADGHGAEILSRADAIWSLGKGTLPHDLAMLVTAEALYRASTINAGHPYHRE